MTLACLIHVHFELAKRGNDGDAAGEMQLDWLLTIVQNPLPHSIDTS